MPPAPPPSARTASAALGLGIVLLAVALPRAPERRPPCRTPQVALRADAPAALRCAPRGAPVVLAGAAPLLFGQALDLNRASPDALEALPGIGPARARAIVLERARAPFCAPAELARVRGIGARTIERLGNRIRAACEARPAGVYRPRENP